MIEYIKTYYALNPINQNPFIDKPFKTAEVVMTQKLSIVKSPSPNIIASNVLNGLQYQSSQLYYQRSKLWFQVMPNLWVAIFITDNFRWDLLVINPKITTSFSYIHLPYTIISKRIMK
jgi:hypothetical protein